MAQINAWAYSRVTKLILFERCVLTFPGYETFFACYSIYWVISEAYTTSRSSKVPVRSLRVVIYDDHFYQVNALCKVIMTPHDQFSFHFSCFFVGILPLFIRINVENNLFYRQLFFLCFMLVINLH